MNQGGITVEIDGLPENSNEYDDEAFLVADGSLREAIHTFWATGARPENVTDTVQSALAEAVAG